MSVRPPGDELLVCPAVPDSESVPVMVLAPHDRKRETIKAKRVLGHRSQHVGKHYMCIPEHLHCLLEGLLKHATLFGIPVQGRGPLEACAFRSGCVSANIRQPGSCYDLKILASSH